MDLKIIYEDNDVLVVDKPSGIIVFAEGKNNDGEDIRMSSVEVRSRTIIDYLIEQYPELKNVGEAPRYGVVHRLDKDTSGILLTAKNEKTLIFFQKQFFAHTFSSIGKSRDEPAYSAETGRKSIKPLEKTIEKKYIALVCGVVKENEGKIKTLIGRSPSDPRKQKVYSNVLKNIGINNKSKREAVTEYKVMQRFEKYTLLEVEIKTGRKHQIRCHLAHIHHPITGDKLYGFKDSPIPDGLNRQFLHAAYLKIKLSDGQTKEFQSDLPNDLQITLNNLETTD